MACSGLYSSGMTTPTAPLTFGSVEYFADQLRRHAAQWTDARLHAYALVGVIASGGCGRAAVDLERIRNILTAAELVQAERAA